MFECQCEWLGKNFLNSVQANLFNLLKAQWLSGHNLRLNEIEHNVNANLKVVQ
ncbi:hypothetical protein [Globicatella sanguinis]